MGWGKKSAGGQIKDYAALVFSNSDICQHQLWDSENKLWAPALTILQIRHCECDICYSCMFPPPPTLDTQRLPIKLSKI